MNSSSVPAFAVSPRSASLASWRLRIWRGDATTSLPSSHCRSAINSTVAGCHGIGRSASKSGFITKSP